ncbi:MAG: transglycosylase SLT domain-containing protein [Muribaculaceae bacterium]|nr:transglycosylase SLT domain-containing protein [Muribaculaceae bacterium]
MRHFVPFLLMIWVLSLAVACGGNKRDATLQHHLPDTLNVGTLYSPTGFFILKGDTMGYDYDRICDFARSHGIALRFKVARSMPDLLKLLKQRKVDILACEIPVTAEYKSRVIHCGAVNETYQVLVQHSGKGMIYDVTQLIGRDVYVEKGSKYESRLRNLDNEVGGGINIHVVEGEESLPTELISKVSKRDISFTIVDSDIAQMNLVYYDSINIGLRVGFEQRSSWAVSKRDQWLADSINMWAASVNAQEYSKQAMKHYFEMNRGPKPDSVKVDTPLVTPPGAISPYDHVFKQYAKAMGWDWRLLAAIAYSESSFDPNATSWMGARGLMQVMPKTARSFGVKEEDLGNPEVSIRVASKILRELDGIMRGKAGQGDRIKFVLAAYNAGSGHVTDAIALARKYELNPRVWKENVEQAMLWKMDPEYYNDSVCTNGYCRGTEPVDYVVKVLNRYEFYKKNYKR